MVKVTIVRNDGLTRTISHVCFGFMYSSEAWERAVGEDFPINACTKVIYHPKLSSDLSREDTLQFLRGFDNVLHHKGMSTCLAHSDDDLLEVFNTGVSADITTLPGQYFVGVFEIYRTCGNYATTVSWVNLFTDVFIDMSVGTAMALTKVLRVPPLSSFKEDPETSDRSVIYTNVDVIRPEFRYDVAVGNFIQKAMRIFKPYIEAKDFRGVYWFWNGELPITPALPLSLVCKLKSGKTRAASSLSPTTTLEKLKLSEKQRSTSFEDLQEVISWVQAAFSVHGSNMHSDILEAYLKEFSVKSDIKIPLKKMETVKRGLHGGLGFTVGEPTL